MLMADFEDVKVREPVMSVDDKRALKTMQDTAVIKEGKFCVGIPLILLILKRRCKTTGL